MKLWRFLFGVLLAAGFLAPAWADSTKSTVTVTIADTAVEFHAGKALVARYHIGKEVPKPYFYPLQAPGERKVTRGVPPDKGDATDHPHQASAWFCHGDIIPEGIELKQRIKGVKGVDFWSIAPGHGKIVCVKTAPRDNGVLTRNEWTTADGTKIMDETRVITLQEVEGGYLFDLAIELRASVCPLTFGDTKEGSLGIRTPDSMTEKKGKGMLTNAEGKVSMKAIWGQHSKWCDYSGPVANGDGAAVAGVTIFDHPDNKPSACWHSRDYGLMAANPFGRAAFPATKANPKLVRLEKGDSLKLRYGLFLHKGDVKEGKVAEAFASFIKGK